MVINKKNITILCILGLSAVVSALTIDTTLTGNGSPGPYPLGWHFVDTSSLVVSYIDTTKGSIPPFIYIEKANGLLFSEPVDSGVVLSVHYTTDFLGLKKTYSLYERRFIDLKDSAIQAQPFSGPGTSPFSNESITISGYKSVGVSFGSQGQLNMEQALEVRIFGKINENTELSANLSDQGTTLEGDTREIGEIDRMYVALENPRYAIVVGDQYVSLPYGGLIEGHKKIKGLSAAYTGTRFRTKVSGAISGGKYAVQTIMGQLGFQGPYYLTGNGEADLITPISRTVKVIVDGKELREGEHKDYVVDYEIGTINFMPTFPINDNSIIQVSYEYKAFDYQRTFLGTDMGVSTPDSSLLLQGALWYETDNKEHPIDLELTHEIIDSLKQSGDTTPLILNGREIHPNDVASHDAIYRLYKLDSTNTGTAVKYYYVYNPYNSDTPEDNKGFYHVWFNQVPQGSGDYILFTDLTNTSAIDSVQLSLLKSTTNKSDPRGTAYYYRGPGMGNYTALSPASAPRRTIKGEFSARYTPRDWLSLFVDVAGEEEDRNLFSDKDDKDNTAAAAKSFFTLGKEQYDERSVWLKGSYAFSSKRFSREIISSYERRNTWDRQGHSVLGNEINVWHANSGATIRKDISALLSYGQYFSNDSLLTHRFGYGARIAPWKHVDLLYSGMFIKHFDSPDTDEVTRDSVSALFDFTRFNYGIRIDDEWRKGIYTENSGKIGGGFDFHFKPVSLTESIYFAQERKGGRSIFLPQDPASTDTGSTFLWSQAIRHSPRAGWTFSGTSSYHLQKRSPRKTIEEKKSVLLITAANDVASVKTGISTHLGYRLSSERASAYVQIPVYVGEGLGTHKYDPVLNEYIEVQHGHGDYNMKEREVFNSAGRENVRKSTIDGNWFFKPQGRKIKGILADLSWRGTFIIDEHIRLDSALVAQDNFPKTTWIPGYSSLAKEHDSLITYSDIFYRQDIDWRPAAVKGLHGNIFARPFLRKVRNYSEQGIEWGTRFDKKWTKWHVAAEGKMHTLNRKEKYRTDTTEIIDRFISLQERYYFIPSFSIFAHESIGKADKGRITGPYYRLQPGLTLRLAGKGWAEVSYTWSRVAIDTRIEYPMAQGFETGTTHVVDCIIDIGVGDHFSIGGNYRGDFNKNMYEKWIHVVSMEVKAYL